MLSYLILRLIVIQKLIIFIWAIKILQRQQVFSLLPLGPITL